MRKTKIKKNKGMTYVELIVVLAIFATMTSVILFSYGEFQAKIDIRNLGSDIALKIVEAQKASVSGKLPTQTPTIDPTTWKPSYGIYFNPSSTLDVDGIAFNKKFIYFTDLNNAGGYQVGEMSNSISITKGNFISRIDTYTASVPTLVTSPLSILFKRPDSGAKFVNSSGTTLTGFDYVQITIQSLKQAYTVVKIYPSGRIQIN